MLLPRLVTSVIFWAGILYWTASTGQAEGAWLTKVQCQIQPGGVLVRVLLSRAADFQEGVLKNPDRLFLDFVETRLDHRVPRHQEIDSDLVSAVRIGQFSQDPPIARVVIDLKRPLEPPPKIRATANGRILLIEVGQFRFSLEGSIRSPHPLQVTRITVDSDGEQTSLVTIESNGPFTYRNFFLPTPPRVVVDIRDADLRAGVPQIPEEDPVLAGIRVSQFTSDTARIVLDLKEAVGHLVKRQRNPDGLLVRLKPSPTAGKVVVVDAGHGGKDPGASGYKAGLREKDIVLDIAQRVVKKLREAGLIALMTRAEDRFVELSDRVLYANRRQADLFVSIHCNAMPTAKRGTRCGIEVYYYTPQSQSFAGLMQEALVQAEGRPDNGIRRRRFYVIHHTVMPSVLVEVGYLDHATEGALLDTSSFRQKVAQGIVNGIQRYLRSRPGTLG